MKNYITIILLALTMVSGYSQTNTPVLAQAEEIGKASEAGAWELTLGGSGTHIDGESQVGADVSLATNPFKFAPDVWLEIVQGLYWEPDFAGSTDFNITYSFHLFKELYISPGWGIGAVYSDVEFESEDGEVDVSFKESWRTGPLVNLQYYVGDSAFLYSGVAYDIVERGENGFRYSFGIGIAW